MVPASLHKINGHVWESADPQVDPKGGATLVTNILGALRLTRLQRQAFISYKRDDTRGVAIQLFHALSQSGYQPFLDLWSINSGVAFQDALWERMADIDLLIFLDSVHALSSRWVHEELARAHALGLGVLQLVWPNHRRTQGTEFSDWIPLEPADFIQYTTGPEDVLTGAALTKVIATAERSRSRSLYTRRLRVVTDLVDQVHDLGLGAAVQPIGPIVLYRSGTEVGRVLPWVGVPDAVTIQQAESVVMPGEDSLTRLIYSGLGMRADLTNHLQWLNVLNTTLKTAKVVDIAPWLGAL